jgi:hypothetical protein
MPGVDEVTSGEIVRTLRGLQDEIRALRGEHVRRDLYEAQRAAQGAELARIDERLKTDIARVEAAALARELEQRQARRQVLVALAGAGVAILLELIRLVTG